jgi:hypothetical protein
MSNESLRTLVLRKHKVSENWQYTRDSGEFVKLVVNSPHLDSPISPTSDSGVDQEKIIELSIASKNDIWGLSNAGIVYRFDQDTIRGNDWVYFDIVDSQKARTLRFSSFSVTSKNYIFGVNVADGRLYRIKDRRQASSLEAGNE